MTKRISKSKKLYLWDNICKPLQYLTFACISACTVAVLDIHFCDKVKSEMTAYQMQLVNEEWMVFLSLNIGTLCDCQVRNSPSQIVAYCYCSTFTDGAVCAKTDGCAWIDSQCI